MLKRLRNKSFFLMCFVGILTMFSSSLLFAEPYIAQRAGMKCSNCHTNITGGGKRNTFGNAIITTYADKVINSGFSPQLADAISIGGNFRGSWTYTQSPDPETVENENTPPPSVEDSSAFSITNGTLYFEFNLDESISFYLDRQVAPEGGRTREALVIYKNLLVEDSYVKAGKMYLPFGLRLQDDQAFIREATGFNFDNSDIGIELGFEPGDWSFSMAASNGTQGSGENNTDKQVSFIGSYIKPKYRLGTSFSTNNAPNNISNTAYNVFGGVNIGKFNLLGEVDIIENTVGEIDTQQIATFLSINYPHTNSLNYKLSYEYFDPNDDVDEDERTRISLLGEKFVNQYMQFRIGIRLHEGIPQNALQNQDVVFTELHLFY